LAIFITLHIDALRQFIHFIVPNSTPFCQPFKAFFTTKKASKEAFKKFITNHTEENISFII